MPTDATSSVHPFITATRLTRTLPTQQPSSDTFELASKVILVTAGRVAFCGPAAEAQAYFCSPALGYSAQDYANPADFIIAVRPGGACGGHRWM